MKFVYSFFLLLISHNVLALHQGRVALPQEFPATVRMQFVNNGSKFICTGLKISPTMILSAAHCFGKLKRFSWDCGTLNSQILIRTETVPERRFRLKGIHVYPDIANINFSVPGVGYRGLKDIAVIELVQPLTHIPRGTISSAPLNKSLWIGGYGQEEINGTHYSQSLKVAPASLGKKVRGQFQFDNTKGVFLLHGDSGGPVYQRTNAGLISIGVNSNVRPTEMKQVYGPGDRSHWEVVAYESLATLIDKPIQEWILDVIQRKPKPHCPI